MALAATAATLSQWFANRSVGHLAQASFVAGLLLWLIGGIGLVELAWKKIPNPDWRGGVYGCVSLAAVAITMAFDSTILAQYTASLVVGWFLYGLTKPDRPVINLGFESNAVSARLFQSS
jgi:hypothetical protein